MSGTCGPRSTGAGGRHYQGVPVLPNGYSDRGYAVSGPGGPELVAAVDPEAADALLVECLLRTAPGTRATVKRIGAGQPWAIRTSLRAKLALRPWGPLLARGTGAPTAAYLADSAFC